MPRQFPVREEISDLVGPEEPRAIGNCKIANTQFHNNYTRIPASPEVRLTIRDVAVYRCEHFACAAHGVAFEDVSVTDIRGGGRARSYLWGCLYSRVTLRGRFGGVLFRRFVDPNDEQRNREFLQANLEAYRKIEWALDISEAQFSFYQDLLGVPAHLIRRNPEKHFIMRRAEAPEIISESNESSVWRLTAQDLMDSGLNDTVIVCGGSGKRLQADIAAARELQDRGLLQ